MSASVSIRKNVATGANVAIEAAGWRLSTYIIGKPGTGKSALLERIAYEDMGNGDGFCFVDPHEVSAEQLLGLVPKKRVNDVIFWNPTDKATAGCERRAWGNLRETRRFPHLVQMTPRRYRRHRPSSL
jgi:hypothetical protein